MAASPSLIRLRKRSRRSRLKPVRRVSTKEIAALISKLKALPKGSRVPADLLSVYGTEVRKVIARLGFLEKLNARRAGRLNMIQWQRDNGLKLARCRDANALLGHLLNRQAHRSRNLYAMAQGKRTALKLGSAHMSAIGKLGAAARWHKSAHTSPTTEEKPAQTLDNLPPSI